MKACAERASVGFYAFLRVLLGKVQKAILSSNQSCENLRMYRMMSKWAAYPNRRVSCKNGQIWTPHSQLHRVLCILFLLFFLILPWCSFDFLSNPFPPHHKSQSLSHSCHHHIISGTKRCPSSNEHKCRSSLQWIFICIICTEKFIKGFLPFQNLFSFCCSNECWRITICRPCYKLCVFCATFGFVLLSRREEKLSIKSANFMLSVCKSYPFYFVCIFKIFWLEQQVWPCTLIRGPELQLKCSDASRLCCAWELCLPFCEIRLMLFFLRKGKHTDSYCAPRHN